MLKLSENPPILIPGVNSLTEFSGKWWVAHTRSRFEKVFAWDMLKQGIGYFLPMREKMIFRDKRKRRVLLPLFPSYVFFCGTETDRYTAMTTNRLCQTIEVRNQEDLISELSAIEKALFNKTLLDLYPHLPVGKRYEVTAGPMKGTEGVVIERKVPKARMVLAITILGQGAIVEIDTDLLEPIC